MRFVPLRALVGAAFIGVLGSAAYGGTVPSVTFYDGNPLYVQSVVGSGPDTAYLTINLPSGQDPTWQYDFNNSVNPVDGWQMLTDIANADPNLLIAATYYSSFAEHYVNNFQYGSAGVNNKWDFDTGSYSSANVSSTNPQGTTWTSGTTGIDQVDLTNNELVGFVDVYPHPPTPVLSETLAPVPEPASLSLLAVGSAALLRRRRRQEVI